VMEAEWRAGWNSVIINWKGRFEGMGGGAGNRGLTKCLYILLFTFLLEGKYQVYLCYDTESTILQQ